MIQNFLFFLKIGGFQVKSDPKIFFFAKLTKNELFLHDLATFSLSKCFSKLKFKKIIILIFNRNHTKVFVFFSVNRYNVLVFCILCLSECYFTSGVEVKRNIAYTNTFLQKTSFFPQISGFWRHYGPPHPPCSFFQQLLSAYLLVTIYISIQKMFQKSKQ